MLDLYGNYKSRSLVLENKAECFPHQQNGAQYVRWGRGAAGHEPAGSWLLVTSNPAKEPSQTASIWHFVTEEHLETSTSPMVLQCMEEKVSSASACDAKAELSLPE